MGNRTPEESLSKRSSHEIPCFPSFPCRLDYDLPLDQEPPWTAVSGALRSPPPSGGGSPKIPEAMGFPPLSRGSPGPRGFDASAQPRRPHRHQRGLRPSLGPGGVHGVPYDRTFLSPSGLIPLTSQFVLLLFIAIWEKRNVILFPSFFSLGRLPAVWNPHPPLGSSCSAAKPSGRTQRPHLITTRQSIIQKMRHFKASRPIFSDFRYMQKIQFHQESRTQYYIIVSQQSAPGLLTRFYLLLLQQRLTPNATGRLSG